MCVCVCVCVNPIDGPPLAGAANSDRPMYSTAVSPLSGKVLHFFLGAIRLLSRFQALARVELSKWEDVPGRCCER